MPASEQSAANPAHSFTASGPLPTAHPDWLDVGSYPFRAHFFESRDGRMHYVDEGQGPPVVLVHGTPTWSFLYRRVIARLVAAGHRVIAPDHLGFGLSDTAEDGATPALYEPQAHARRLAALLQALDLPPVTLVVHDFGGAIGVSFAEEHPDRIAGLVVLNSWLWPLDGDARIRRGGRLAAGSLGRWLYLRLNASPRWLVPAAFADRARLSRDVHRHYLAPFHSRPSRLPLWVLARALLGASAWYDGLWQRRDRLTEIPALLVWGMRDPTFGPAYLTRWREALPNAEVIELADAGHFVQEEAPDELAAHIEDFLARRGL